MVNKLITVFFCLCVVMANSIYFPKLEQTVRNLSRALFKLRIVRQIKEISILIHSAYFKGREHFCIDVLQAIFIFKVTRRV